MAKTCNKKDEIKHYNNKHNEICVEKGLVYFNKRLIIQFKKIYIKIVHETHLGIRKTRLIVKNNLY